jgi:hypothetical protein
VEARTTEAEGRDRRQSVGFVPDSLSAKERLVMRKQKNKPSRSRHGWFKAEQEVHQLHYLVQYDSEVQPAPPEDDLDESSTDAVSDLSEQGSTRSAS